ncbi:ABC transporter permease [uncultured Amphritea sp.]|uniref:ABC transporter permease n=1 Tax=uncultured Amphritea sp. TaxID=981605 RepID=UPI00263860D4|nr:ABC transporter permease [uncultured Amphritea sp.]
MLSPRTPWQVTRAVWHALFMREALARTTSNRMAWFWMLLEPIALVAMMVGIRSVISSGQHNIGGVHFIPWLICGLFSFFLFRENMIRSIGAVSAYKGLFSYRQVKPIDPVFIRCYLEGMLKSFIFMLFIIVGLLLEIDLFPAEPLEALFVWLLLWMLGLGAGLTLSVLSDLVPEIGKIINLTSMPLILISSVMIPLNYLPHQIQRYLILNPIVHGVESLRVCFFDSYRAINGISIVYLSIWALGLVSLGLLLHLRFAVRLKAQ